MFVRSLQLRNFRNYQELDLALSPEINVLLGANAQGKTNIIEAAFYASLGHSHRTQRDADLIRWDAPTGAFRLAFTRLDAENQIAVQLSRETRRRILLNGQAIRTKELIGTFHAVLFSPEDLFLIKGAPAGRRRFLDGELSQASPSYYRELVRYGKIVVQRNVLLKRIRERREKADMLSFWDAQLAASAEVIVTKRREAVKKLNMLAKLMQRRMTGQAESLAVHYEVKGMEGDHVTNGLAAWYNKMLKSMREADVQRGATGVGPHHDDLVLSVNGVNLRTFGSQGQQRTGVLALKLAELDFLRSETGEYPVLLLDDVMSELDEQRRHALLAFLRRERIQTIITATDAAYFPKERIGTYYEVHDGRIREP